MVHIAIPHLRIGTARLVAPDSEGGVGASLSESGDAVDERTERFDDVAKSQALITKVSTSASAKRLCAIRKVTPP